MTPKEMGVDLELNPGFAGRDDERARTTPFDSVTVCGVILTSRYDKADELDLMARTIRGLPEDARRHVQSMWCDSKATYIYMVELRPGSKTEALAEYMGKALEQEFLRRAPGGLNGIFVDDLAIIDPYWEENTMTERKSYDFANWQIGDNDTEMLLDVVRTNIRTAFEEFAKGSWRVAWNDDATDNPGLLWWHSPFDEDDDAFISLQPAQLQDALLEAVGEDSSLPASKQTILEALAAWRAAVDAAEEAARELPDDDDE
jgi:hypothetical protein